MPFFCFQIVVCPLSISEHLVAQQFRLKASLLLAFCSTSLSFSYYTCYCPYPKSCLRLNPKILRNVIEVEKNYCPIVFNFVVFVFSGKL